MAAGPPWPPSSIADRPRATPNKTCVERLSFITTHREIVYMNGLLSTRQAADRLGVSEATVRRWSDQGVLPVRRVGKRGERRFRLPDLEALVGERAEAVQPSRPPVPSAQVRR